MPGLLAYIRLHIGRELRSCEDSVDLAQSVCREVLAKRENFQYYGEGAFRAWLFTKALSKIRDRLRYYHASKRDIARLQRAHGTEDAADLHELLPSFLTPSQVAIGDEAMQRIEAAFEQLPEDYRQVITLARVFGLGHAEVAERLERSVAATRVLLHRALVRLAVLLSNREILDASQQASEQASEEIAENPPT